MTNPEKGTTINNKELSKAQLKFLQDCERFGWGKIQVEIKDGQPVGWYPVVINGVVQQYTKCD